MRKIGVTALAALLLASCGQPANSGTDAAPSVPAPATAAPATDHVMPHIKRPNLVVADIERALTIYRDILGLTAGEVGESSAESFSYPVFNIPAEAKLRSVALSEPGEARVLALTEVTGIDLPSPPAAPHLSATVIGITDLAAKFEQIAALGLKVTGTKIDEGADFTFIEQAFVDYDGHLIVCYEVLPDGA